MRKPYPSDLTDAQWTLIEPLLPPPPTVGRPRLHGLREIVNAIFYLNRSGCQWDILPHDLPPRSTVYDYFVLWRDDGTWQRVMDALRRGVRQAIGREPSPSVASIDSQTVKGTEIGGARATTAARRSTGSSDTSSWTRWAWCWWSPCRRPAPTMGPMLPRCCGA